MLQRLLQNATWLLVGPLLLGALLLATEPALAAIACAPPKAGAKTTRSSKARKVLTPQQSPSLLSVVLKEQSTPTLALTAPAPAAGNGSDANDRWGVAPYVAKDKLADPAATDERQVKTPLPGLEPAPQLVAGVVCELSGGASLNLGYTLPTSRWGDLVQPLGFSLTDDADQQRISIGIDIPF